MKTVVLLLLVVLWVTAQAEVFVGLTDKQDDALWRPWMRNVARHRLVDLNEADGAFVQLRRCLKADKLILSPSRAPTSQTCTARLDLNLFDHFEFTLNVECFYRNEHFEARSGIVPWAICHGRVPGDDLFMGVLLIRPDSLAGFLERPNGDRYNVIPTNGRHLITEYRRASFPSEMKHESKTGPRQSIEKARIDVGESETNNVAGSIDVLVLVTPYARETAVGTENLRLLVEMAVEGSNLVVRNTLNATNKYYTMVGFIELGLYKETFVSLEDELDRITYSGSDWIYTVQGYRDSYGADLVSLIVDASFFFDDDSICGIAWFGSQKEDKFQSAMHVDCLYSGTMAHELGHNMGCDHAYGDGGSSDPTPSPTYFNYCYRVDGEFRTIMAYDSASVYTPQYPTFSNPAVRIGNKPAGDTSHNNARMFTDSIVEPKLGHQVGWNTIMNFRSRRSLCSNGTNLCTTTSGYSCCSSQYNICCDQVYYYSGSTVCCSQQYPHCCNSRGGANVCCPPGYPVCCSPVSNSCCKSGYRCSSSGTCILTSDNGLQLEETGAQAFVHAMK